MVSKELVNELRDDYEQVVGTPFKHFFCPILFVDEDVVLCKAHIVNKAFPDTAGNPTTIQRADVDSFYGSRFESDFLDIQHINRTDEDVFSDIKFWEKFEPRFISDGMEIGSYLVSEPTDVPPQHTPLRINFENIITWRGLKISPTDMEAKEHKWEIEAVKDLQVQTFVSLLKAAHLTFFKMIGYGYVFSATGIFIGKDILGEFFIKNKDSKDKKDIIRNAKVFFRPYIYMMGVIKETTFPFEGTISDKTFLLCNDSENRPWATIVLIKTVDIMHAIMLPVLEPFSSARIFWQFLHNDDENLRVSVCRYDPITDTSEVVSGMYSLIWPKTGTIDKNNL